MLRNWTQNPVKKLKTNSERSKSVMGFVANETGIYVRGKTVPRSATNVGAYLRAAASVDNVIGPRDSPMRKQAFYKGLTKVEYQHIPQRAQFIERYLQEIHKSYERQASVSKKQLDLKLELATERYRSQQEATAETSPKDDKNLEKILRKIRNEHTPEVSAAPGSPGFKYIANSIRMLASQQTICFCVDVEAFERNTNVVTEIGISIYDPRESLYSTVPNFRTYHLIVAESLRLRNGNFVCDVKDCFLLGESYVMSLSSCVEFIQTLLNYYMVPHTPQEATWRRAFVGHNVKGDLKWLSSIGVNVPADIDHDILKPSARIAVLDTEKLYRISYGSKGSNLGKILRLFQIPHSFLHNAGNDAYFTLKLLLHMCDISYRRRLQMDDFYGITATIETWAKRETTEAKILPLTYVKAAAEFTNHRVRKKTVHQTEFGGCRWFDSAMEALACPRDS